MKLKEIIEMLNKKVLYRPHSEYLKGNLYLTGCSGKEDNDDSCVMISPESKIDVTGNVYVGRYVNITKGVHILTHDHDYTGREPLFLKAMTNEKGFTIPFDKVIDDDVWIFKSVILPKCTYIAKGVVIGVGSIVTKDIKEEYSIWAGNPAKKIGMR